MLLTSKFLLNPIHRNTNGNERKFTTSAKFAIVKLDIREIYFVFPRIFNINACHFCKKTTRGEQAYYDLENQRK